MILDGLDSCPFCDVQLTAMNGLDRMPNLDLYCINHYCEKIKGRISIDLTKTQELKNHWNRKPSLTNS